MIHLDTSFLIQGLRRGSTSDRRLREWIAEAEPLAISSIVWSEFLCGPVSQAQVELATNVVRQRVPFTEADAVIAAQLFNDTGRRRGSLVDCMIAATAIGRGVRLATLNQSDFHRFEPAGLRFAN